MDAGTNAMTQAPQPSPLEQALQQVDRNISDLIDEISALEGTVRPVLTPEGEEKGGPSPTSDSIPQSVLTREIFNVADRIRFQTERLNVIKRRVEL